MHVDDNCNLNVTSKLQSFLDSFQSQPMNVNGSVNATRMLKDSLQQSHGFLAEMLPKRNRGTK